jgi:hypothetical protein
MDGKPRREREGLPRRGGPNPHMELSFPRRRTQIARRGKPRTERPSRERERDRLEKLFRRERGLGLFMKTDIPI